jgi:hemoglobin
VDTRRASPHISLMSEDFSMDIEGITEDRLKALVDLFYGRVRQDPLIGPVFNRAIHDWPEHLDKLQAFWSSVMLTSGRYKGRPLPAHIKHGDRINPASFARWLELWREATDEILPPAAAAAMQEKAARIADSLSLGIEFARGGGGELLRARA